MAVDPDRTIDIYNPKRLLKKQFTDIIKGLPCSAGYTEGCVRVTNSPEEGVQLQCGEILVAITTNVGWTPIFPRCSSRDWLRRAAFARGDDHARIG